MCFGWLTMYSGARLLDSLEVWALRLSWASVKATVEG